MDFYCSSLTSVGFADGLLLCWWIYVSRGCKAVLSRFWCGFDANAKPPRRMQLLQVVNAILHAESDANLVVLSGDMVSGFRNKYSIKGWFEQKCASLHNFLGNRIQCYHQPLWYRYTPLLLTLASHAIPHAVVLGNHDSEGLLERTQVPIAQLNVMIACCSSNGEATDTRLVFCGSDSYGLPFVWAVTTSKTVFWFVLVVAMCTIPVQHNSLHGWMQPGDPASLAHPKHPTGQFMLRYMTASAPHPASLISPSYQL